MAQIDYFLVIIQISGSKLGSYPKRKTINYINENVCVEVGEGLQGSLCVWVEKI